MFCQLLVSNQCCAVYIFYLYFKQLSTSSIRNDIENIYRLISQSKATKLFLHWILRLIKQKHYKVRQVTQVA